MCVCVYMSDRMCVRVLVQVYGCNCNRKRHKTQSFQNGKTFLLGEDNKDTNNNGHQTRPGQARPASVTRQVEKSLLCIKPFVLIRSRSKIITKVYRGETNQKYQMLCALFMSIWVLLTFACAKNIFNLKV